MEGAGERSELTRSPLTSTASTFSHLPALNGHGHAHAIGQRSRKEEVDRDLTIW